MNPIQFSVSTFLVIRVGDAIGDLSGLYSILINKPTLISRCPLSDDSGEFTIENELISTDSLEKFCRTRVADSGESIDPLKEKTLRTVSNLLTESIEELDLVFTQECEAKQYIRDFMKDDSSDDIGKVTTATDTDEDELFGAIFSYEGWEIGDILLSEEPDLPNEIEVCFIFDCNLNADDVVDNLSGSSGEEVPEESKASVEKILSDLKSRYGLGD